MANPTLTRYREYHYPGGEDHDQEDHGNWADGTMKGNDETGSGYLTDHRGVRVKVPNTIAGHEVIVRRGHWLVRVDNQQVRTDDSEIIRVGPFDAESKYGQLVGVNEGHGLYRKASYRHTTRPDLTWHIVDRLGNVFKTIPGQKPAGFKTVPVPDLV